MLAGLVAKIKIDQDICRQVVLGDCAANITVALANVTPISMMKSVERLLLSFYDCFSLMPLS